MFSIRPYANEDIEQLWALDPIAQESSDRRTFIQRSVEWQACFVITSNEDIIGYSVLEYSFYEQGFVAILYTRPDYRHQGAGSLLMEHMESICQTAKLFTSTNLSNRPMQALLAKRKYILSGVIHHLDEDDPELVFVKYLQQG
jgi:GNAT superfamily N-acetyltransferase